ncbi:MAG: hypothetical protein Fur002_04110 [Anaerolineales bacterium]
MKIIDKTPLQDEKGNFSLTARVQAALKYGARWLAEAEAQQVLLPQLERVLEKGFVVIRNFTLPGSDIVIPLILVGLGGVYLIYVISDKGQFQAKGDQWYVTDKDGSAQPARFNPLETVNRLTRAFQRYLEINNIKLPAPVQPVVIDVNPGAHIDSMRPVAKVFKSDSIKAFAASLLQLPPIFRKEQVNSIAEKIVEPPAPIEEAPAPPPEDEPLPSYMVGVESDAAPAKPFDAQDFASAFVEDPAKELAPQTAAAAPQRARAAKKSKPKTVMGMTQTQVFVLAGLVAFWLCLMLAFGALIYFTQPL